MVIVVFVSTRFESAFSEFRRVVFFFLLIVQSVFLAFMGCVVGFGGSVRKGPDLQGFHSSLLADVLCSLQGSQSPF